MISSQCVIRCRGNEYYDSSTNACLPANSFCATASHSSLDCTSYNEGTPILVAAPIAGQFNTCTYGKYWDGSQCTTCDLSCETCIGGTSTSCTSCRNGLAPSAGACVYSTCAPNCLACIGTATCVAAASGFYITHSNIVARYTNCKGTTYFDPATSTCKVCHPACGSCYGPNWADCIHCKTNYFRYGALCVTNPTNCNLYQRQGVSLTNIGTCVNCLTIHAKCLQCVDLKCVYCDFGFYAD